MTGATDLYEGKREGPQAADADRTDASTGSELGAFASEFLKAPTVVASPFPSSRHMVRRLLDGVRWDEVRLLVEFGPGTGAFTRYALSRMRADATLLAIDTEAGFIARLTETLGDPRLVGVTGSALDVADITRDLGFDRIDCVISGLPFSTLSEADGRAIIDRSAALMDSSGVFLAYQVRRTIEAHLQQTFQIVERRYHLLNLPPCHLYHATARLAPV